jgi:hypothetical protein
MRGIPRPSPAMIVALVGIVIGLGGVAFATIPDSSGTIHGCYNQSGNLRVVESANDCRKNETPLAWNQQGPPGPPGTSNTAFAEETSEVSTTSFGFTDLGGPTVTVNVPPSGLIEVLARVELKGNGCMYVNLFDIAETESTLDLVSGCVTTSYFNLWSTPVTNIGSPHRWNRSWTVVETSPGPHTYALRYRATNTGGNEPPSATDAAFFRNRKLWIRPVS